MYVCMLRGCGTEPNASSKLKDVGQFSRTILCLLVRLILGRPFVLSYQCNYSLLKPLSEGDGSFKQNWRCQRDSIAFTLSYSEAKMTVFDSKE